MKKTFSPHNQSDSSKIQHDFPDFIVAALDLDNMVKLPVHNVGDRTTPMFDSPDDAIDFIRNTDTPHNIVIGWNSEQRPFISFRVKLTFTQNSLLTLYRSKDNSWNYSHSSTNNCGTSSKIFPINCSLGRFLTDPSKSKDEKVAVLKRSVGDTFQKVSFYPESPNDREREGYLYISEQRD